MLATFLAIFENGKLKTCFIRPPGYSFIEFEDAQDAEDAIRGRDGYSFDGHRLRVKLAHVGQGLPSSGDCYSSYSGGGSGGHGSGSGSGHGGVSKRSEFRVIIHGLPSSASWQDLKDHMRRAGDVCFAQVFRDGNGTTGIVDYSNYEDMKYAIRKLDDSEFRNPFARSYIRVKSYVSNRSVSRSHSRSFTRSRSRDRSRSRSQSRSRSRSISRNRSQSLISSRSRSLSRSRSQRSRSRSRCGTPPDSTRNLHRSYRLSPSPPPAGRSDQSPSSASSGD